MILIQFIPEAARFRPVNDLMRNIMDSRRVTGVPASVQELENRWDALSRWGYRVEAGVEHDPYYVGPHAGYISSLDQLRRTMMLLLGNLDQAPPDGDFKHGQF